MNNYLIFNLIKNGFSDKEILDFLKHELDWHLYDYGDHMVHGNRRGNLYRLEDFKDLIKYMFSEKPKKSDTNVLSYIPFSFDSLIKSVGFNPVSSIFYARKKTELINSFYLLISKFKLNKIIRTHDFNEILYKDIDFLKDFITNYQQIVLDYNFKALLLSSDQQFISRISLDIFNKCHLNSFIFSHGLPANYTKDVDNRSKYLLTWGDQIKRNYVSSGFDPNKVFSIGSPKFRKIPKEKTIFWNTSSVYVFPESSVLWHQHTYGNPKLMDRTRVITYLYDVQYALKKNGVNKAVFRTHPSINSNWILKFIDRDFYECDKKSLSETIDDASLIIGGTSTTFIECVMKGVNYIVYERKKATELYPPFDGSDSRVPVSFDVDSLSKMISDKRRVKFSVIQDYLKNFDAKMFKDLLNA